METFFVFVMGIGGAGKSSFLDLMNGQIQQHMLGHTETHCLFETNQGRTVRLCFREIHTLLEVEFQKPDVVMLLVDVNGDMMASGLLRKRIDINFEKVPVFVCFNRAESLANIQAEPTFYGLHDNDITSPVFMISTKLNKGLESVHQMLGKTLIAEDLRLVRKAKL